MPMRTATAGLIVAGLLFAPALTACSSDEPQYEDQNQGVQVCLDPKTNERVPDEQCRQDNPNNDGLSASDMFWAYMILNSGQLMPGYYQPMPASVYHYDRRPLGGYTYEKHYLPKGGTYSLPKTKRVQATTKGSSWNKKSSNNGTSTNKSKNSGGPKKSGGSSWGKASGKRR